MLVAGALVVVMEVAVVEIVAVTVVFDGGVSAAAAEDTFMGLMGYVLGHDLHFSWPDLWIHWLNDY